MAQIFPFEAWRYSTQAGSLQQLVTQPYDKITPRMQERYSAQSPNNLVHVILPEKRPEDTAEENGYTRAAATFNTWIGTGILERDTEPALYAYSQQFKVADTGENFARMGFIGLGALEEYEAGVVHRHEQTLSAPKQDRLELLRHTHAHFGQIFMLYSDPQLTIDRLLKELTTADPLVQVEDEYGTVHRVWRIVDPARIAQIQQLMSGKKLIIADGHHRYETALTFRRENPELPGADRAMMTFVNLNAPGLQILATHRVLYGLEGFNGDTFLIDTGARKLSGESELRKLFATPAPGLIRVGVVVLGKPGIYVIERPRAPGTLDVQFVHSELLGERLGVTDEAVREQRHIAYVRDMDEALQWIALERGQIAFLLEPTPIDQVAEMAFRGGVLPQKATDFYPKLLSGLVIYKLD